MQRQQTLAAAQGQIAQGLIQVYRALGGGWQIRCDPELAACGAWFAGPGQGDMPAETLPAPKESPAMPKQENGKQ